MGTETQGSSQPATVAGIDMSRVVREAWLATAQLSEDVTPETRESAFQLVLEAMLRDPSALGNGANVSDSQDSTEDEPVSRQEDFYSTPELRGDAISYYLDLDRDLVEQLYSLEVEPTFHYNGHELSQQKQPATKEITLLVLAGRTAVGLDTTTDQIRFVAKEYRKLDSPNFMSTLQQGPEFVVLGKPRKGKRVVRLRAAGVEAAKELAQRLVTE